MQSMSSLETIYLDWGWFDDTPHTGTTEFSTVFRGVVENFLNHLKNICKVL